MKRGILSDIIFVPVLIAICILLSACSGTSATGSKEAKADAGHSLPVNTFQTDLDESNSSSISFGGLDMQIPPEFGGPDAKSDDTLVRFYLPKDGTESVVMLMLQTSELDVTNKEYEKGKSELISGFLNSLDDAELKERNSCIVAGLPAERFLASAKISGYPCMTDNIIVFSEENKRLVMLELGLVGKDYRDYRNVLENIAGSARVSRDTQYRFKSFELQAAGADSIEMENSESASAGAAEETGKDKADSAGIDPDFKAALDSYERFFDEYISIMNQMKNNPTDLSLLSRYTDYLGKYADMMEEFEALEKADLSKEELAYYLEVSNRITQKLLDVL